MKSTAFLIALLFTGFFTSAQTLQSVTSNGASTTNTLTLYNPAGLQVIGQYGSPAYMIIDQLANSGGKKWRMGNTGAAPGFGSFDIYNITDNITPFSISSNGFVGLGSLMPDNRLTLRDNNPFVDVQTAADGQTAGIWMRYQNTTYAGTKFYYSTLDAVTYLDNLYPTSTGSPFGSFNIRSKNSSSELVSRLYVHGLTGNVGIGTSSPSEKLAVNGNIRAKEVKVENANWPDYVFAKSYELPSLQSTEQHIKENGHLPGIPSAAEVKVNGLDLGEMNAKLLQKIEELTLYLIEIKKAATVQKEQSNLQIDLLKKEIDTLKSKVK